MIFIKKELDFTLKKNNNVNILKNNVAYFKILDKILFEVDDSKFELTPINKDLILKKENNDFIFILDSREDKSILTLKENNISFDIVNEYINVDINNNIINIEYKLESDEEKTNIIIKLN